MQLCSSQNKLISKISESFQNITLALGGLATTVGLYIKTNKKENIPKLIQQKQF